MSMLATRGPAALARLGFALAGLAGCVTTTPEADPELDARRARSHFDIAADHMKNGRVELAVRQLLKAEELDPTNARVQHGLGITLLQKGKPAESERHLRRAIELEPRYHEARFNLSTLYMKQGRYEPCVEHARTLYDDPTYPTPWRALNNWGWCAYRLGRVDEARRHLAFALESNSRYWPALLNLGILETEQGHRDEAIDYFNRMLALQPGRSATAEVSYRLAEIYVSLGRREEAVGLLRTAVVKAPDDPWGKKSEEYLRLLR